ncbi:MAG: hypothetical protein J7M06_05780, partial [Proteobacteria bacterium]|nr:hypothetical protein [Pseudomonadota bacterium]
MNKVQPIPPQAENNYEQPVKQYESGCSNARNVSVRFDLKSVMDRCGQLFEGIGPQFHTYREKLFSLKSRLDKGRFHLAVLGQFKR